MPLADLPRIEVTSRAQWREWLSRNHDCSGSIWLVTYRRSHPFHLPYAEVVEEALCFGWIDSRPAKLDDDRTMLLLSPRKAGSRWSKLNKERIARMEALGCLHPAGQAKIAQAKADGSWAALEEVDALKIPDDLAAALETSPTAQKHFQAFPPSTLRGILEWLLVAKTEATRRQRIAETVALAELNVRANTPAAQAYKRSASTKKPSV